MQAIDGHSLSANESVTIPVPLDEEVASSALDNLAEDREILSSDSIAELEKNINDIVFDLFGIDSDRHQQMIRRFNRQYEEVEKIDPDF